VFCPLDSILSHKFGYIIQDARLRPMQLIILPYLHERKIFLNRIKFNTNYFYTSIQRKEQALEQEEIQSSMIAINLTESKLYVYSDKGLLKKRIKYTDLVKKNG